jgi:hypothetical protein
MGATARTGFTTGTTEGTAGGTTGGSAAIGTGAAAVAGGQKDIVRSEADEEESSSCAKGRSNSTAEVSVDATDAGASGDPPRGG